MSSSTKQQVLNKEIATLKETIARQKNEIAILKNVVETLPGSIYWKDKNGVYQYRNETGAESMRNFGFPWRWEDTVGKTDYDLFPKEIADGFRKNDFQVMDRKRESAQEEKLILPSGKIVIQLSTKKPWCDKYGDILGVIGNTIDITSLKKVEGYSGR